MDVKHDQQDNHGCSSYGDILILGWIIINNFLLSSCRMAVSQYAAHLDWMKVQKR